MVECYGPPEQPASPARTASDAGEAKPVPGAEEAKPAEGKPRRAKTAAPGRKPCGVPTRKQPRRAAKDKHRLYPAEKIEALVAAADTPASALEPGPTEDGAEADKTLATDQAAASDDDDDTELESPVSPEDGNEPGGSPRLRLPLGPGNRMLEARQWYWTLVGKVRREIVRLRHRGRVRQRRLSERLRAVDVSRLLRRGGRRPVWYVPR